MPKILALCPPVKPGDSNILRDSERDKQRANIILGDTQWK